MKLRTAYASFKALLLINLCRRWMSILMIDSPMHQVQHQKSASSQELVQKIIPRVELTSVASVFIVDAFSPYYRHDQRAYGKNELHLNLLSYKHNIPLTYSYFSAYATPIN